MTPGRIPALPEDAILVHIGPHKTGTTAIQSILAHSRPMLREAEIYYPGKYTAQHRAAMALRQYRQGGHAAGAPPPYTEWEGLAQKVAQTPHRAVLSSEFLAEADASARASLVHGLGPERVHLVAAARNPAMMAVSTWQQVVRTFGRATSLEGWLEENFRRADETMTTSAFWARADTATLVARWAEVVPADRITVIVIDENDRRLLPATFEQLLGLPDGALADQRTPFANRGLSSVEAALVARIVEALESRLSYEEYKRTMRGGVIRRLLESRQPGPDEGKTQLPGWALEHAALEADRISARLQQMGVRIVGDLGSLRATSGGIEREEAPISQVPLDLAAEAVVGAIAGATRGSWRLDAPRRPARGSAERPDDQAPSTTAVASPRIEELSTREVVALLSGRWSRSVRRRTLRVLRRETATTEEVPMP